MSYMKSAVITMTRLRWRLSIQTKATLSLLLSTASLNKPYTPLAVNAEFLATPDSRKQTKVYPRPSQIRAREGQTMNGSSRTQHSCQALLVQIRLLNQVDSLWEQIGEKVE